LQPIYHCVRNILPLVAGPDGSVFYTEDIANQGSALYKYTAKDQKSIELPNQSTM
jgi:hypothetical protein